MLDLCHDDFQLEIKVCVELKRNLRAYLLLLGSSRGGSFTVGRGPLGTTVLEKEVWEPWVLKSLL